MLERLVEFGISEGFFDIMPLGKLEKNCCSTSKIEIIDYDKTKEMVTKTSPLHQPKSADALKILPQLNRIDFIELKGFEKFIQYNNDKPDVDEEISNQVKKFGLTEKIRDSLFVLSFLIKFKNFKCTKTESEQYQKVKKNYLIVVDIDLYQDPIKDRLITLAFLSENTTNIKRKIAEELNRSIDNIPCSSLENLEKPKLLNCRKIDGYYEELLRGVS